MQALKLGAGMLQAIHAGFLDSLSNFWGETGQINSLDHWLLDDVRLFTRDQSGIALQLHFPEHQTPGIAIRLERGEIDPLGATVAWGKRPMGWKPNL